jgi:hypothetical protein
MRQIPASPHEEEVRWKLQLRLCQNGNHKFEVEETFYEQFKLIDNCQMSIRQLKSGQSQRLQIQLMCQDKK